MKKVAACDLWREDDLRLAVENHCVSCNSICSVQDQHNSRGIARYFEGSILQVNKVFLGQSLKKDLPLNDLRKS